MEHQLKMLPVYSLLLIFINYFCLSYYFGHFGVEIYNYIDITELLLSSLPIFKNMMLVLFIVAVLAIIIAVMTFLGIIIGPAHYNFEKIIEDVIEEKEKERNPMSKEQKKIKAMEMLKDKMGIHLSKEVAELYTKIRGENSKFSDYRSRLLWLSILFSFLFFMIYNMIVAFLEAYYPIKQGSPDFFNKPDQFIGAIVMLPIFLISFISMFFGPGILWEVFFKNLFRANVLPYIVLVIYFIVSLLYKNADVLKMEHSGKTDNYQIFESNSKIATVPGIVKFLGRTNNYIFLLKKDHVNIVKIENADSLIISRHNSVR